MTGTSSVGCDASRLFLVDEGRLGEGDRLMEEVAASAAAGASSADTRPEPSSST